jgi:phosphatidylglycerol---prolipoprotein diacylglyceryl transferase
VPAWLLIISATISLAFIWVNWRAISWGMLRSHALDLALLLAGGAAVGGRLLHVFYEQPDYYRADPKQILFIWQGGFVFYGGLVLGLGLMWAWCRRRDQSFWRWADFFAPVLAVSYALGRIGCFADGCCYGRACPFPWGVEFHNHAAWGLQVIARHPTQLYAAAGEALIATVLLWRERRPHPVGQIFAMWLGLHGLNRLVMEYFRDDFRGPQPLGLSFAGWISLALVAFSLARLIMKRPSLSK